MFFIVGNKSIRRINFLLHVVKMFAYGMYRDGGVYMDNIFGYVRVSTREQNIDRQLASIRDMGVPEKNIFIDYMSGKDFNRPKYKKLIRRMERGSLLYIHSIDRLGRNYKEIIEEWRRITKQKGVDVVVLDMPLLDTRRGKDLMGTFLADIVLQVLSFVAENERSAIRQRQAEGIREAMKRGVRFGRPRKPMPTGAVEQYARWKRGETTLNEAAKACGMPRTTFYVKAREAYMNQLHQAK